MRPSTLFVSALVLTSFFVTALSGCSGSSSNSTANESGGARSLNDDCDSKAEWDKRANGIVGGKIVEPDAEYARDVVQIYGKKDGYPYLCSGTLIDRDIILTAAHCIGDDPTDMFISFYTSRFCEKGYSHRRMSRKVISTLTHADYNSRQAGSKNDIALIRFEGAPEAGYEIKPLLTDRIQPGDTDLTMIGFGITGYYNSDSQVLRVARKPLSSVKELNAAKSVLMIDQRDGTGVCSGDSGGPLYLNRDGRQLIIGVASFVTGETQADFCKESGGYTYVPDFVYWIEAGKTKVRR